MARSSVVSLQVIASIIQPESKKYWNWYRVNCLEPGYRYPRGMVLTGGTSNLGGITRLVEEFYIFQLEAVCRKMFQWLPMTLRRPVCCGDRGLVI